LSLQIDGAGISPAGAATVTFTIADGAGVPLERTGRLTVGAVTASFVLASLDDLAGYTAYTGTAADVGGTYAEIADGRYRYTFGASAAGFDGTRTHTVGVWASRDFEGQHYVANVTFDFRPDGMPVSVTRELVTTAGCDACHDRLSAHGGDEREVKLCVTCHQDFPSLVHQIHQGAKLPSVLGGGASEWSAVVFPQDTQNCTTCHVDDRWKTRPGRAACTACHDRTWLDPLPVGAGYTLHTGGPQATDQYCTVCHQPTGGIAPIVDSHLTPLTDPASPTLAIAIDAVSIAGATPSIDFTVTENGAGLDLSAAPLASLRVTVAGPTTDYATEWQETIQPGGVLTPIDAAAGKFRFDMTGALPTGASGTYAFALEGYVQVGTNRFAARNVPFYVAVTDPAPVARRTVVDGAKCDSCHFELSAHGGIRSNPQYCVMCHSSNLDDASRIARVEGTTVVARSVKLDALIHGIHTGKDLSQGLVLGGFPAPTPANPIGTPEDFGGVLFPGLRQDCTTCHQTPPDLPLINVLPSLSETLTCTDSPVVAGAYCTTRDSTPVYTPPETAACTSCHDQPSTIAHAETMTTTLGQEACATCHARGEAFGIDAVHALAP
jgi:OmcA/MtrC family decaheme c-type cytochrome